MEQKKAPHPLIVRLNTSFEAWKGPAAKMPEQLENDPNASLISGPHEIEGFLESDETSEDGTIQWSFVTQIQLPDYGALTNKDVNAPLFSQKYQQAASELACVSIIRDWHFTKMPSGFYCEGQTIGDNIVEYAFYWVTQKPKTE